MKKDYDRSAYRKKWKDKKRCEKYGEDPLYFWQDNRYCTFIKYFAPYRRYQKGARISIVHSLYGYELSVSYYPVIDAQSYRMVFASLTEAKLYAQNAVETVMRALP